MTTTQTMPSSGGMRGLVEALARVFAFLRRPGPEGVKPVKLLAKPSRAGGGKMLRKAADVRKLAGAGVEPLEISRRTGLSQDIVGMLINLSRVEAAESADKGTFFRILQSRIAA